MSGNSFFSASSLVCSRCQRNTNIHGVLFKNAVALKNHEIVCRIGQLRNQPKKLSAKERKREKYAQELTQRIRKEEEYAIHQEETIMRRLESKPRIRW